MKLIIEIDVDSSDFTERDVEVFKKEAEDATGLSVEVNRPVDDELSTGEVFRMMSLSTEYFKVRVVKSIEGDGRPVIYQSSWLKRHGFLPSYGALGALELVKQGKAVQEDVLVVDYGDNDGIMLTRFYRVEEKK